MTSIMWEFPDGSVYTVGVVAEYHGHDYTAHVLHDVEAAEEWVVTWTDGVANTWFERYDYPWVALARFAALLAAAEQDVLLIHDPSDAYAASRAFVSEAERFVSRTVHASSCAADCDGTDPVNHGGQVASDARIWRHYWKMWCEVNDTTEHPADEATPERQDDLVNWLLNERL